MELRWAPFFTIPTTSINHLAAWYRKHLKHRVRDHAPLLFISGWILAEAFALIGYSMSTDLIQADGYPSSPLDIVYYTLYLFPMGYRWHFEPNIYLQIARFLAPLMWFSTIALVILHLLESSVKQMVIRNLRGHVVICGLGLFDPVIAQKYLDLGFNVVAIDRAEEANLDLWKQEGAITMNGDPTDPHILEQVRIARAGYCIIATTDDSKNIALTMTVSELVENRGGVPLNCFVHLVDPVLERQLTAGQISLIRQGVVFDFFNIYRKAGETAVELWSRDHDSHRDEAPSVAVIDIDTVGENLIVQLARAWSSVYRETGVRLPVVLHDPQGPKAEVLERAHPGLAEVCDLSDYEPASGDSGHLDAFCSDREAIHRLTAVFICIPDQTRAITVAMKIKQTCCGSSPPGRLDILVRTAKDVGLGAFFEMITTGGAGPLRLAPFPIFDERRSIFETIGGQRERVARVIHDTYREGRAPTGAWEELPEDMRNSSRGLADDIEPKLKAVGFRVEPSPIHVRAPISLEDQIEALAESEHERYVRERRHQGWTYNPVRNDAKKQHDGLLLWKDIDEKYRRTTREMVGKIPEYLENAGLMITRSESPHPQEAGSPGE